MVAYIYVASFLNLLLHGHNSIDVVYDCGKCGPVIIESVDSISRDGPDCPYM